MDTDLLPERSVLERFRLDDKVVVVTGATSGLGVAFAQACAQAGADVVVAGRRAQRLEDTVALIEAAGRTGLAVAADVTLEEDCQRVVESTVERFGRIDVLVNNAGIVDRIPASRLSSAEFQRVLDVNLTAGFRMAQAAVPAMRPGSSIVNVASAIAHRNLDVPATAYTASKAGLLGLTRSLAKQWSGRRGIRVNALAPGFFPSELTDELPFEPPRESVVIGRMGDPAELAAALVFLAGDASTYMTGAELVVDGGYLL